MFCFELVLLFGSFLWFATLLCFFLLFGCVYVGPSSDALCFGWFRLLEPYAAPTSAFWLGSGLGRAVGLCTTHTIRQVMRPTIPSPVKIPRFSRSPRTPTPTITDRWLIVQCKTTASYFLSFRRHHVYLSNLSVDVYSRALFLFVSFFRNKSHSWMFIFYSSPSVDVT